MSAPCCDSLIMGVTELLKRMTLTACNSVWEVSAGAAVAKGDGREGGPGGPRCGTALSACRRDKESSTAQLEGASCKLELQTAVSFGDRGRLLGRGSLE